MIQFRCSGCDKAIGVDDQFGGRLIKCPACQGATRVPAPKSRSAVEAIPVQASEAPTMDHVPKVAAHPSCPSCKTELFNPSDNVCGVCGFLLDHSSANPSAIKVPAAGVIENSSEKAKPIPGYSVQPYDAIPVNPAVTPSTHSADGNKSVGQYNSGTNNSVRRGPTMGRSIGGWLTAVVVGAFCALIWGVVASFFGTWAQAIGWGIGALVGLIAGLIARNPSMKFCAATTGGAILCMFFGRVVSAWVIMLFVSTIGGFGTILMPDNAMTIGVMERLIEEEALDESEAEYAQAKVDEFFANEVGAAMGFDVSIDLGNVEEFATDEEIEVDLKVRKIVRELSAEEKEELLEKIRQKHPDWIEKDWHRIAVIDSLVQNNEIEDEKIKEHANAILEGLNGVYDGNYYQENSQQEIRQRNIKLGQLVTRKYAKLSPMQRKEVFLQARKNHLAWNPVQKEYLVMLECMYQNDEIPKELKPFAKSQINQQLEMVFDDAFEQLEVEDDIELTQNSQAELSKLVNEKLLELDEQEVEDLIAQAKERYPGVSEDFEFMENLSAEFDDAIAGFNSDGTFLGSLKTRFTVLDYVWLFLGSISAFAIAFTLGQSGKKATT